MKEPLGIVLSLLLAAPLAGESPVPGAGLAIEMVPADSLSALPDRWRSRGQWAMKPSLSFRAAAGKEAGLHRALLGDGFILAGFQPLAAKPEGAVGVEVVFPGGRIRLTTHLDGQSGLVSLSLEQKGKQLGQKQATAPPGGIVLMLERKGDSFSGWFGRPGMKLVRLAGLDWAGVGPVVQAGVFGMAEADKVVAMRVPALQVGGARPDPQEIVEIFDDTGAFVGTVKRRTANLVDADYSAYRGGYENGKKHGKGAFTWPDGASYVGEFKDDEMHGKGIRTDPDGTKYVGAYEKGQMSGEGTFTWPDGSQYTGQWKDNKRHGKGVFSWPSGDRYEGDYTNDRESGGWFFSADGKLTWARVNEKGEWVFGK